MDMPSPPMLPTYSTPSSRVAMEYLNYHLDLYRIQQAQLEALRKEPRPASTGVSGLQQLAAFQVVKSLWEDPAGGVEKMLTDSVPVHLWDSVINDPRIHYSSFRRLNARKVGETGNWDEVDVWVQRNEKWLRVDGTNWGLVTLDDAKAIFPTATHTPTEIIIPRRQPPSTSFCFLDEKRPRSLSILPSNELFIQTFNRVTNGCLKGLDWNNVFLAGGMPLNALLCTQPGMEDGFPESDLDIFIYGLGPKQANEKVEHVYEVWCTNVGPESVRAGLCIKNSKTITFLGKFPDRRIQIVLKIVQSPAEVLLNFDLDPCTIGFDGKRVLMLPRAARALETGYTVFTSFLVFGHHLEDRNASQKMRCFKYGWRGFGIRILSCSMEDLILNPNGHEEQDSAVGRHQRLPYNYRDKGSRCLKGLKAVKRVATSAEDMVRRFFLNGVNGQVQDPGGFDYRTWVEGPNGAVPVCSFKTLNWLKPHIGHPNERFWIGNFELFFRHCAAWKLECEGRIKIDYNDFVDMYETKGTYGELPSFSWNGHFNPERLMKDIDAYNCGIYGLYEHFRKHDFGPYGQVFNPQKVEIIQARIVYSKTLQGAMDQQLAIPVVISKDLEDQLTELYDEAAKQSGLDDPLFYPYPTRDASLMIKLWLIGKQTMWARVDRTIDEIFEILWPFFHLQKLTPRHISRIGSDPDNYEPDWLAGLYHEHLERRVLRPTYRNQKKKKVNGKDYFDWPSEEEKELFDFWVWQYPRTVYRGDEAPFCSTALFDEQENLREPDENKYWGSEDEEEEGKVWRDIVGGAKREGERVDSQSSEEEIFWYAEE